MNKKASPPGAAWRTFRIPLVLALVSGGGLVAALLFDGPIDVVWGGTVAIPLLVIIWALATRR